jgi:hypothetical protein
MWPWHKVFANCTAGKHFYLNSEMTTPISS